MTIKQRPIAPRAPHMNPELKQGQTYRIIGARSQSYQDYVDRYFVVACTQGRTFLIYLEDTADTGGYDGSSVIGMHGLDFIKVDLQEV